MDLKKVSQNILSLGAYSDIKTDIDHEGEDLYCPHNTYYFAFVLLILLWLAIPISICIFACCMLNIACCMFCCATCANLVSHPQVRDEEEPPTTE